MERRHGNQHLLSVTEKCDGKRHGNGEVRSVMERRHGNQHLLSVTEKVSRKACRRRAVADTVQ